MTPGWIKFRHNVFKGWDKGLANENFPRHTGGAIVLDGIGYVDQYMTEQPEAFLEYSDWMGIPIQGYPVTLDRLKSLLVEQAKILIESGHGKEESDSHGKGIAGTLSAMSPEQVETARVDQRSDLFSLGIVLFELTTGQRLYGRRGDQGLMLEVAARQCGSAQRAVG